MAAKKPEEQAAEKPKRAAAKKKEPEPAPAASVAAGEPPKEETPKETAPEEENGTEKATGAGAAAEQQPEPWKVGRVLKVTVPLMQGDDVRAVQQALIAAGYPCGREGANGVFGRETARALRSFQAARRMIVDGKAGRYSVEQLGGVWDCTK